MADQINHTLSKKTLMADDNDENTGTGSPSLEEQVKYLRNTRKRESTRFQKTTEFNVKKKLKKELERPSRSFDAETVDKRLEDALNRERENDIFDNSLVNAVKGKKSRKTRAPGKSNSKDPETSAESSQAEERDSHVPKSISANPPQEFPAAPQSHPSSPEQQFPAAPQMRPFDFESEFPANKPERFSSSDAHTLAPEMDSHSQQQADALKNTLKLPPSDTGAGRQTSADEAGSPEAGLLNVSHPEPINPDAFVDNFPQTALEFKTITGLDLYLDSDGSICIQLEVGGDGISTRSAEAGESGLIEAYEFATTLVDEYCQTLSEQFGIEFARPGELTVRQLMLAENMQYRAGDILPARRPRIDELKALHRAIEYSWPASYQLEDQLPLRVVFIDDFLMEDDDSGVHLKFLEDGRPLLFITPDLARRGVPTELDPIGKDSCESWQASIMRQLSWKSAVDCHKFPLNPEDYELLGWQPISEPDSGLYALRGRDGYLYLPLDVSMGSSECWSRCNEQGIMVNSNGSTVATETEAIYLSDRAMSMLAAVPPASELFFSAEDEIVEALRSFRQGPQWRAKLARHSPVLYKLVKNLDQMAINRCYSPSKGYTGLVRSAAGALVDNVPANLKELSQFEQKHLKKQV